VAQNPSTLQITVASTNYSFSINQELRVSIKPQEGELRRTTARPVREDIRDSAWSISSFTGLGVAKADIHQRDPDNRLFSSENIMTHHPGLVSLGPKKQSSTFPAEVVSVEFTKFRTVMGETFAIGTATATATDADEAILYLDSSANWVDTTARDDVNNSTDGTYIVTSIVEHKGRAYAALAGTMVTSDGDGGACRIIRTDVGGPTVWVNYSSASTTNGLTQPVYGLETDGTLMYASTFASNSITVNESSNDGVAWNNFTSNPVILSAAAPRGAVMYSDSAGALDYWVSSVEGLWRVDISAETTKKELEFWHSNSGYTGQIALCGGAICVSDGPDLHMLRWLDSGILLDDVIFTSESLPALKRGDITALTFVPGYNWHIVAVGGQDGSHNAGIYLIKAGADNTWETHNLYYNATANRVVYGLGFTTETAGTPRILFAEDNGVSNDSAGYHLDEVTRDPRTVSSYKHASAGKFVLPKNDRYLPEFDSAWRKIEFVGTAFDSSEKVTDVFAQQDASIEDTNGSSWGSTLGEVTSSGSSLSFAATPSNTGESGKAMQILVSLEGGSDASPYIEAVNVHVKKRLPRKYVRSFVVDIAGSANGTARPRQAVIDDLEAIVASVTDSSVTYGEEDAIIMEPWDGAEGALTYTDDPEEPGTVKAHQDVKFAVLSLVEV
jgi:hypothetical protein